MSKFELKMPKMGESVTEETNFLRKQESIDVNRMELWYVYAMSNKPDGVIYIGLTNNIEERVKEHKLKLYPKSFSAKYNCNRLIYFEEFKNDKEAIIRERQLKKWKRDWKIKLIQEINPSWIDMSMNWNLNLNTQRNG
jgi:putative endonuclease